MEHVSPKYWIGWSILEDHPGEVRVPADNLNVARDEVARRLGLRYDEVEAAPELRTSDAA